MTETLSPISAAIAELLAAVGSTCGNRGSPHKPAAGFSLGPGRYQRFFTVGWLDGPPLPHLPVRECLLIVKLYGVDYLDRDAFGMAGEAVFRDRGARVAASGLGIWHSAIQASMPDEDPAPPTGTGQPLWALIVRYPTTIDAI
jgi:hypothetical protein